MTPGIGQIIIIAIIVLLLFGAGRIPKLMEDLGKGVNSFKKGLNESGDDKKSPNKAIEDASEDNKKE